MSTITTRAGKGSALTHNEVDANFTNLNTDKVETSDIGSTVQAYDSNLTSFVSTFTLPTTDGSSGQVLKTNGSGALTFVDQSGGLTYFNDSQSTASPNNTVPVNALTVANANTNVDVVLAAKGEGAHLAQVPNSSTSGGNKRGSWATDWQKVRDAASMVASGSYATVTGGKNNTASGSYSVASGWHNDATAQASTVVGGILNDSYSSYGVSGGYYNAAGGQASVALGYNTLSTGYYSVTLGYRAADRGRFCTLAMGGRNRSDSGHPFQTAIQNLSVQTTDATATKLSTFTTDNAVYWNRLDANSAYAFRILLIANVSGGGDTKAWEFLGAIKKGSSVASTALVGSVVKNIIASDSGAASWDADIAVDVTTTGAFTVEVTGAASTTIRWSASVYTAETEY